MIGTANWPSWHHGVLLLYGGQLAINSCGHAGGFDKDAENLDFPSSSGDLVRHHAHLHTWQNQQAFSKFSFASGEYDHVVLDDLDLEVAKDYAMYMALKSNHKGIQKNVTTIRH